MLNWARAAAGFVWVATLVCAACGSFGSDGMSTADAGVGDAGTGDADAVAACLAETCPASRSSCLYNDFSVCGSGVDIRTGDLGRPGVVGECRDGRLHVAADSTYDVTASVSLDGPDIYDSIRISTLLAVAAWDRGAVLKLTLEGAPIGELHFALGAAGHLFSLCSSSSSSSGADCAPETFGASAGEAHRFTFELTSTTLTLSVDCKVIAKRGVTVTLAPRAAAGVVFGKNDATAIDATLDDLTISFQ